MLGSGMLFLGVFGTLFLADRATSAHPGDGYARAAKVLTILILVGALAVRFTNNFTQ